MAVFDYSNHYEMKKMRLKILKDSNWKCDICNGKATEVHHADETKSNHDPENLIPICRKCHWELHSVHLDKPIWNIHKLEYYMMKKGLDKRDLASIAGLTYAAINQILKRGSTKNSTMKKIADAMDVDVEEFIIYGNLRSDHREYLDELDDHIQLLAESMNDITPINDDHKKYLIRTNRYSITKDLREHFKLNSWTEIKPDQVDEAINFIKSKTARSKESKTTA